MNNKLKLAFFVVTFLLIGYWLVNIVSSFSKMGKSLSESSGMQKTINNEYLNLFKTEYRQKFDTGLTFFSTTRNPVSALFLQPKYKIFIFELHFRRPFSLRDNIRIDNKQSSPTSGVVYNTILKSPFNLSYASGKPSLADSIFISKKGAPLKITLKNDSTLGYYFQCKNFSLAYKQDGTKDIVIYNEGFNTFKKFPVELVFLKRADKLYFIIMSVSNTDISLEPGSLIKMIDINE